MTRQEAIEFDDELKTKLMKASAELGMDEKNRCRYCRSLYYGDPR